MQQEESTVRIGRFGQNLDPSSTLEPLFCDHGEEATNFTGQLDRVRLRISMNILPASGDRISPAEQRPGLPVGAMLRVSRGKNVSELMADRVLG